MTTVSLLARAQHVRRGVHLEWFTIAYNSLEGLLALVAGFLSGSVALVGFGLDSAIEVTWGATLLWRLRADAHAHAQRAEATALRVVGGCFLVLAAYVSYDATHSLAVRAAPQHSVFGIVLAARTRRRLVGGDAPPGVGEAPSRGPHR